MSLILSVYYAKAMMKMLHSETVDAHDCVASLAMSTSTLPVSDLALSDDITMRLLQKVKHQTTSLPSSTFTILKAAILSYQTWAMRYDGLKGVLLGSVDKRGRTHVSSVTVDYNVKTMVMDWRLKSLNTSDKIVIVGVALSGDVVESTPELQALLEDIIKHTGHAGALALVDTNL